MQPKERLIWVDSTYGGILAGLRTSKIQLHSSTFNEKLRFLHAAVIKLLMARVTLALNVSHIIMNS